MTARAVILARSRGRRVSLQLLKNGSAWRVEDVVELLARACIDHHRVGQGVSVPRAALPDVVAASSVHRDRPVVQETNR